MFNLQNFKLLLCRELSLVLANLSIAFAPLVFLAAILMAFKIALGAQTYSHEVIYAFLIVMIYFAVIMSSQLAFKDDKDKGFVEQVLLANIILEYLVAKWFYGVLINITITACSIIFAKIFFNLDVVRALPLIFMVPTVVLIANFSALINQQSPNTSLGVILTLPMIVPVIIFAHMAFHEAVYSWLLLAELLFTCATLFFAKFMLVSE